MANAVQIAGSDGGQNTAANPLFVSDSTGPAGVSASAAQITPLASLATSQQLIAANTARRGMTLINTDANAVLIKYGPTASATSFTYRIPANNGQWVMDAPIYTGRIDAIWEADGSGSLYGTELS